MCRYEPLRFQPVCKSHRTLFITKVSLYQPHLRRNFLRYFFQLFHIAKILGDDLVVFLPPMPPQECAAKIRRGTKQ